MDEINASQYLADNEIDNAQLPAVYEAAINALAQCESVDECKEWADKAIALCSYARQAQDDALFNKAARIKARAIRRCGELLKEIEASVGGRPSKTSAATDTSFKDKPVSRVILLLS